MKLIIFVLSLFILPLNTVAQQSETDYTEAVRIIEVWLDAQKDYENLPGIMAAAGHDQDVIWSGAFGMANREEGRMARPETLNSICSISKLFTSVSVMKLYDEGKLRLDDPIRELLPWFDLEQRFDDSGPLTIRSFLTHSSGLPRENAFSHWNSPYRFPTEEQIREALSGQETLYPASTYYQYSNLTMALLGQVVAELADMKYEEYVRRHILDPLQMNDTRPYMPEQLHGNELAVGYGTMNRDLERPRLDFFEANGVNAAAGFSSNVIDLLNFAAWQFRLYNSDQTEILKPSTLRNMHNVHWIDSDWENSRGLGFNVQKWLDDSKWVGHGGYCPGYQSTLMLNPDTKRSYSVMINANGVNPNKYVAGIHGMLSKAGEEIEPGEKTPPDLSEYMGFYRWDILNEAYIAPWKGHLALLNLPSDNPAESMILFQYVEEDLFRRVRDEGTLGETLRFERNESGEIEQVKRFDNWTFTKVGE